jgi:hypothetical protein
MLETGVVAVISLPTAEISAIYFGNSEATLGMSPIPQLLGIINGFSRVVAKFQKRREF